MSRTSRWTTVTTALAVCAASALLFVGATPGVNQCNLGNKLYSIENGGTVCAPLAPFQCIQSCQWNTSCANTAHSLAFQGRRTFVAGMILTVDNFLLLCCATFANVVQQNQRLENRCVWVPPIQTIENGPSIRFDPPLSNNEYVRDMNIERLDRGKVQLRVQICKFMTQRTNCDEATMPPDDQQLFSLLQLRLQRTESYLREHGVNGTNPREFFELPEVPTPSQDSFRDEVLGGRFEDELRGSAFVQPAAVSARRSSSAHSSADAASDLFGATEGVVADVVPDEEEDEAAEDLTHGGADDEIALVEGGPHERVRPALPVDHQLAGTAAIPRRHTHELVHEEVPRHKTLKHPTEAAQEGPTFIPNRKPNKPRNPDQRVSTTEHDISARVLPTLLQH